MSVLESRICRDILREEFGCVVERVASVLIQKGRLTSSDIYHFTKLKPADVRQSLIVLLQHHLIYYADDLSNKVTTTYYEANVPEVLLRLRIGTMLCMIEKEFGKEGHLIVLTLFTRGFLRLKDLYRILELQDGKENVHFTKVFTLLVKHRFIKVLEAKDNISPTDRRMMEEQLDLEQFKGPPTNRELADMKKLKDEKNVARLNTNTILGMKRKFTDTNTTSNNKRLDILAEVVDEVDEDVFWKINYEQFNIRLRNSRIIHFVGERINQGAEAVMKAAFAVAQDKMRSCEENQSISLSATLIAHHLPSNVILQHGIVSNTDGTKLKPSQQQLTTEFLDLLCTDQVKFLSKIDERSAGQYKINLTNGANALKTRLVESVIKEKYGSISHRIFRILSNRQKLDEKQISKIALVPGKVAREKLHQLAMAGLVELQEVPKSMDRVPSRTYYLWY
ncbi:RNA polymerase III subunit C82, partial [Basidiobolus ranarum]